jgi:hypothetical protein
VREFDMSKVARSKQSTKTPAVRGRRSPRKARSSTASQPKTASASPNIVQPEAAEPKPAESPILAAMRDHETTSRLLAEDYQCPEWGETGDASLADLVYAGFASAELKLEVGTLRNLSSMANGLVQAQLSNFMTDTEFRLFAYDVARDIRERSRAAAELLERRLEQTAHAKGQVTP